MTIGEKIRVCMAPGEGDRSTDLILALHDDPRFESLQIDSAIPVDLQFANPSHCDVCNLVTARCTNCFDYEKRMSAKYLNMELKRPIDFVQSVLNGHLMDQTLSIRESGYNGCTVILGGLDDLYEAIKDASKLRAGKHLRGDELSHAIATTHARCKSFRKRSFLNGVPIFHKGDDSGFFDSDDQWKDILELASDYLTDGDMLGFRRRPAENDREVAAASMLHKGIGSDSMRVLLKEYTLAFVPRGIYARPIEELPGWGKKRCELVNPRVRMVYR